MAFKSEFMKIFKEGLEPYGFKRMKGTDFFGKLVNEEILLFISFKKYSPPDRGLKAFDVISGVQTIYSPDLSTSTFELPALRMTNYCVPGIEGNIKAQYVYNESNLSIVLEEALTTTKEVILPLLTSIKDLKSCVEFLVRFRFDLLYGADTLNRDSVLLIMTDNHDSFEAVFRQQEELAKRIANDDTSSDYYRYIKKRFFDSIQETIESRDRVWASKELQEAVHKEAARRAEINKAQLRKYGFDI